MQYALRIALSFPRVIEVDVDVADITHARMDERIGRRANVRVGHPFCEVVPTIPAHGHAASISMRDLNHPGKDAVTGVLTNLQSDGTEDL